MNILLADDHDLVREGLKHTLTQLPEMATFTEAASADEVMQALLNDLPVHLIILDLPYPVLMDWGYNHIVQ